MATLSEIVPLSLLTMLLWLCWHALRFGVVVFAMSKAIEVCLPLNINRRNDRRLRSMRNSISAFDTFLCSPNCQSRLLLEINIVKQLSRFRNSADLGHVNIFFCFISRKSWSRAKNTIAKHKKWEIPIKPTKRNNQEAMMWCFERRAICLTGKCLIVATVYLIFFRGGISFSGRVSRFHSVNSFKGNRFQAWLSAKSRVRWALEILTFLLVFVIKLSSVAKTDFCLFHPSY